MAPFFLCCRDALAVVGWLATWMYSGHAGGAVAPASSRAADVVWHVVGEGRGTPAVYGGTAFFLSKHHALVAIDISSGRVAWRRPTGGPGPTTAGTTVLATPSAVIAGDGGIAAFAHDGRETWRFEDDAGSAGTYLGGLAAGMVLAGSSAGRLWALDAASGDVRWVVDVVRNGRATVFAPVVADAVVYAAFTAFDDLRVGGIVAVDVSTGRVRWRRALPRTRTGGPRGMAGGPLAVGAFVFAAGHDGTIHAIDRTSGEWRWSFPPDANGGDRHELRMLVVAGRHLIAGSLTGLVTAYDLATRQERWRWAPMSASIAFGMATDGRTVYVPYLSGCLVALDAEDGVERWRTREDTVGFSWKPLVVSGRVLAASSGAGFFAFRL